MTGPTRDLHVATTGQRWDNMLLGLLGLVMLAKLAKEIAQGKICCNPCLCLANLGSASEWTSSQVFQQPRTAMTPFLTFVDRMTKQAHFVATKTTIGAQGVADLYLQNIYRLHGLSKSIVSDRDPRFTAEVYKSIFQSLGIQLDFSTANHPQTDGITERVHRTIGQILRSVINHRQNNWEELFPLCEFAYNDMVQESTGETPFFLNFSFHPVSAPDVFLNGPAVGDARSWLEAQQSALQVARDCIQGCHT